MIAIDLEKKLGRGDVSEILLAISAACILIEGRIRRAGLSDILGAAGYMNVQGEQQQKLDVFANDTIIAALRRVNCLAAIVSEEDDEPIVLNESAKYVAIFDPLDGSSNIDVNVNVGTIVSIQQIEVGETVHTLKQGSKQLAALYVVYGPSTILVYTTGNGVFGFTLDPRAGSFRQSWDHMQMPQRGPYYSVNEANVSEFSAPYLKALQGLRDGSLMGEKHSSRYIGSLVADFHRTLMKGGVFLYPPTVKTPNGKLRLLYEANPLAMIAEQAGGLATDGCGSILDLVPEQPHQRTAFVIGSRDEVKAIASLVGSA